MSVINLLLFNCDSDGVMKIVMILLSNDDNGDGHNIDGDDDEADGENWEEWKLLTPCLRSLPLVSRLLRCTRQYRHMSQIHAQIKNTNTENMQYVIYPK